ncbi:uncharacterized protein AMSG_08598 [Thecamonas trahens ATCC 50062]|uniref:Uncharacterized protein n=1 Tax=Thecamonas trahens ATCC 50062 TaxID=461836 RepID=A0A0L0DKA4_THETB|nr:hypothetical protein AMSG_08598 [Thecamonas trahens ATCC 50062]KNC52717.1 hypothetical protein AMSG_08598 [Thecamonas trahens ATCC 50062]|eukprot:XP_013755033.1 hypothetical protein AMSG_08598 [Thecamonas trahens ATCC 50062]
MRTGSQPASSPPTSSATPPSSTASTSSSSTQPRPGANKHAGYLVEFLLPLMASCLAVAAGSSGGPAGADAPLALEVEAGVPTASSPAAAVRVLAREHCWYDTMPRTQGLVVDAALALFKLRLERMSSALSNETMARTLATWTRYMQKWRVFKRKFTAEPALFGASHGSEAHDSSSPVRSLSLPAFDAPPTYAEERAGHEWLAYWRKRSLTPKPTTTRTRKRKLDAAAVGVGAPVQKRLQPLSPTRLEHTEVAAGVFTPMAAAEDEARAAEAAAVASDKRARVTRERARLAELELEQYVLNSP